MTTEHEAFERAAAFRIGLARYLGVADVPNVGIALGPGDDPLVTMPLARAERLLRDAVAARDVLAEPDAEPAEKSPGDAFAETLERHAEALTALVGTPVTIARRGKPPVAGIVLRVVLGEGVTQTVDLSTDRHGDVEVRLEEILSISAGNVGA